MRYLIIISIVCLALGCKKQSTDSGNVIVDNQKQVTISKTEEKIEKPKHPLMHDSIVSKYQTIKSYGDKEFYYSYVSVNGDSVKAVHDYMDIDSLKIMGRFTQYSPYDSLISQLGTPDSSNRIDEFGDIYTWYYYRSMDFYSPDYNDFVYCTLIDFNNDSVFITYDSLLFNSRTSIEEFMEIFPLSSLNFEHNRKYNNEIQCDWFRFEPKANYQRDDELIFLFHKKRLRFFIYFDAND